MKKLLPVTILLLTACSSASVVHHDGELPKIDIGVGKDFCDKQFVAKVRRDELIITCAIKIE
jgi:hypothetical protein